MGRSPGEGGRSNRARGRGRAASSSSSSGWPGEAVVDRGRGIAMACVGEPVLGWDSASDLLL